MKTQPNYEDLIGDIDMNALKAWRVASHIYNNLAEADTKDISKDNAAHLAYGVEKWKTFISIAIDYIFAIQEDIRNFRAQEVQSNESTQI